VYTHRQTVSICVGIVLGLGLYALDQTIVAAALPTIGRELGGLHSFSWVVTAYLLAAAVAMPLAGKLGDRMGRHRLFRVMIAVFLAGSVLCAAARTLPELVGARAIQGFGGGGLFVVGQALIADVVPPRERGRYQGYFGAAFAVATLVGPTLGGLLTDHASWRVAFLVNLPVGAAALVVTRAVLPSAPGVVRQRADALGAVLVTVIVALVVLATGEGGTAVRWRPWLLGVVAALVVAFVLVERRAVDPVLPPRLFGVRTFRLAVVVSFAVGALVFAGLTFLPLFLQVVLGHSPTAAGLLLLPLVVGTPATSILAGRFMSRTGRYRVLPIAGTGFAVVAVTLLATMDVATSEWRVVLAMTLLSVGFGLTNQTLLVAVQNVVRSADVGVATSTHAFTRAMGSSIGVAVFGAVFRHEVAGTIGADVEFDGLAGQVGPDAVSAVADAVAAVFAWALPLAVGAWLASWFVVEVPLRTTLHSAVD
jgi:EmrB/QacA subfamily drug resistance transporter